MRWPGGGSGGNASSRCRATSTASRWRRSRRDRDGAPPVSARRSRRAARSAMLAGLHQAEMALGQRSVSSRGSAPRTGTSERGDGVGDQHPVAFAADAVEHDAGDADGRVVTPQSRAPPPPPICACAGDVEHQQHRQAESARRGRRSRRERPGGPGTPSNRPMTPSITRISASRAASRRERVEQRRRHRPAVEIDARRAGRGGVERGIDVVRAGLGRPHRDAAPRAAPPAARA